MNILDIVDEKCCAVNHCASKKSLMLHELAELAVKSDVAKDIAPAIIENALKQREDAGSTGFGNEIAIPHARIEGLERFLVFIVSCRRGVNFEALDRKRVKLFFVILGPAERVNEHLQVLAFVSRTIGHTDVKEELLKAPSPTALYETFVRHTDAGTLTTKKQKTNKLLIVNIYDEDHFNAILEVLLEEGVEGSTIIDTMGMGHYISNIPMFASFTGFMRTNKNQSKTILALVPEDAVEKLVSSIENITGDLNSCQGAMVMTIDVSFCKGSMDIV